MKTVSKNFLIDLLAYIAFILLVSTGLVMHFLLPPGSGHNYSLMGMDRHQWGDIHFWVSVVFLSLIALHILFHWKWVLGVLKGRLTDYQQYRTRMGMVGFLAITILLISPVFFPVEVNATGDHDDEKVIRGSTTLEFLTDYCDQSLEDLSLKLELTARINHKTRMREIADMKQISMEQLRFEIQKICKE